MQPQDKVGIQICLENISKILKKCNDNDFTAVSLIETMTLLQHQKDLCKINSKNVDISTKILFDKIIDLIDNIIYEIDNGSTIANSLTIFSDIIYIGLKISTNYN
jgi:hypothetical protein